MFEEPVRLASSKPSEQEEAEEIKTRIRAAFAALLIEFSAARARGFIPQFSLAIDPLGRDYIADLHLLRRF